MLVPYAASLVQKYLSLTDLNYKPECYVLSHEFGKSGRNSAYTIHTGPLKDFLKGFGKVSALDPCGMH